MNNIENGREAFYKIYTSDEEDIKRRLKSAISASKIDIKDQLVNNLMVVNNFISTLIKDKEDPRREDIKAWLEHKISKITTDGVDGLTKVLNKVVAEEFKARDKKLEARAHKNYLESPQSKIDWINQELREVLASLNYNREWARNRLETIFACNLLSGDIDLLIVEFSKIENDKGIKSEFLKALIIIKELIIKNDMRQTDANLELFLQIDFDKFSQIFEQMKVKNQLINQVINDKLDNAYTGIEEIIENLDNKDVTKIALPKDKPKNAKDNETTMSSLLKEIKEQIELKEMYRESLLTLGVKPAKETISEGLAALKLEVAQELEKVMAKSDALVNQEPLPISAPRPQARQNAQPMQRAADDTGLDAAIALSLQEANDLELQAALAASANNELPSEDDSSIANSSPRSSIDSVSSSSIEEQQAVDGDDTKPSNIKQPPLQKPAKKGIFNRIGSFFKWLGTPFRWFINLFRQK